MRARGARHSSTIKSGRALSLHEVMQIALHAWALRVGRLSVACPGARLCVRRQGPRKLCVYEFNGVRMPTHAPRYHFLYMPELPAGQLLGADWPGHLSSVGAWREHKSTYGTKLPHGFPGFLHGPKLHQRLGAGGISHIPSAGAHYSNPGTAYRSSR